MDWSTWFDVFKYMSGIVGAIVVWAIRMEFALYRIREWIAWREKEVVKTEAMAEQRHEMTNAKLDKIADKFERLDRLVALLDAQYSESKIYLTKLGERTHKLEGTMGQRDQAILNTLDRIEEQMAKK